MIDINDMHVKGKKKRTNSEHQNFTLFLNK